MGIITETFSYFFSGSSEGTELPPLQRKIQGQSAVVILVVGRSGSGKTSLIDAIYSPNPSGIAPQYQTTTEVATYRVDLSETRFKLIDTPGFDHVGLNDVAVCDKIAGYFWDERRYHLGVNGIIYIHQAGDSLQSRSLRRYLTMLSRIFLGNEGMHRLTFFVPHVDPQVLDTAHINEVIRDRNSILNEVSAMGARITSGGGLGSFTKIVKSYKSTAPIILPIQGYNPNLVSELENILHEKPMQHHSRNQEAHLRNYQQKVEELRSSLGVKESEIAKYRDAYRQIKDLHAGQQGTEAALRQQLQQVQREYASLRSELQLQENFEQSEIVQELEDLNRHIEDISRSISAYLTDNHVHIMFEKEPAEVTALDARNLTELFKLLQHDDSKCSLVCSAKGEGLDIESFMDFTIRDMLCTLLVTAIFQPFHPAIDSELSDALLLAYEDIQKRESQTKSGKWRSSTFKSVYKDNHPDQVAAFIDELMHRFTRMFLSPLITCVFGSKDATMERKHFNQMHELVKRAWDWNAKLKGEVVVLGDFQQTMYASYSIFDPNTMQDFEPRPNSKATSVLGTVGLGLISLRAVGGGRSPEETLVFKATVVTDTLYA